MAVKRSIQLPKGRRAARNPLRNLASRSDIAFEYTEVKSGIAEREMRRIKAESCKFNKIIGINFEIALNSFCL